MPAIYRYLRGDATPSLDFLTAAARVLGVRPAWLAFEEGKPTEGEETRRRFQEWQAARIVEGEAADRDAIRSFFEVGSNVLESLAMSGDDIWPLTRAVIQRNAVLRFGQKLSGADSYQVWDEVSGRHGLMRVAARFLLAVDRLVHEAVTAEVEASGRPVESFPVSLPGNERETPGSEVEWADAVLALFSRRVYGLGTPIPASMLEDDEKDSSSDGESGDAGEE